MAKRQIEGRVGGHMKLVRGTRAKAAAMVCEAGELRFAVVIVKVKTDVGGPGLHVIEGLGPPRGSADSSLNEHLRAHTR
jgi:hypothetical protein